MATSQNSKIKVTSGLPVCRLFDHRRYRRFQAPCLPESHCTVTPSVGTGIPTETGGTAAANPDNPSSKRLFSCFGFRVNWSGIGESVEAPIFLHRGLKLPESTAKMVLYQTVTIHIPKRRKPNSSELGLPDPGKVKYNTAFNRSPLKIRHNDPSTNVLSQAIRPRPPAIIVSTTFP